MTVVGVGVLGPLRLTRNGAEVDLGTHRHRQVIAVLALAHGRPVTSSAVIDQIWGERPPATARATLHGYVAALRRLVEPDRAPRAPAEVLTTEGDAYALRIGQDQRDDVRFEKLVSGARQRLTVVGDHLRPRVSSAERELVELALDELDDALALWHGAPYDELDDVPAVAAHRARLEDLLRMTHELRAVGQLALGRHDLARAELENRTAENPLHERWCALRAVALARESRQADALAAIDELRTRLIDQLGVDLSPPLQELRTAILRQDPSVTGASATSAAPGPVVQASTDVQSSAWQLLGRPAELAGLRAALAQAGDGRPAYAALSGPPGIGKSRLMEEIAVYAAGRGWQVAVGRCTQEVGAPPLWPWLSVLEALGLPFDHPAPGPDGGGGAFQIRAGLVEAVQRAADNRPFLLVFEDLHWADTSTLAVLKLLAQSTGAHRLLTVATWRSTEDPRSDLSGVAEAFARRHSTRIELEGLDRGAATALFEDVSGLRLDEEHAADLYRRTDGSPFFVVELARHTASGQLDVTMPNSVTDVLGQRLGVLPEDTQTVLRTAAVLGHTFDLETLADVTRSAVGDLLDSLEPALRAGLLTEERAEIFRFSHALVADVLLASSTATRLARTHQLVAEILERRPGREAEVARHWQAAGPRHVGRAWRALAAAASVATSLYAYVDAAELLQSALDLQSTDPEITPADQLALLEQAREACRWAALRPELIALVERSIALADITGDVTRLADAACDTSGMLWRSAPDGEVNDLVVDALHRSLAALPESESALRSRVLAALPIELYDVADLTERTRWCDEALALARNLDDPALLCDVLLQAAMATWAPSTASFRLAAALEAVELARLAGLRHTLAMSLTLATNVYSELGRPGEMRRTARLARELAIELKIVYVELVLDVIELAWAAAAGLTAECEAILAAHNDHLALLGVTVDDGRLPSHSSFDLFCLPLFQGLPIEQLPGLVSIGPGSRMDVLLCLLHARGGRLDLATAYFRPHELETLTADEDELACPLWCAAAEVALYFDARDLARQVYGRLASLLGRSSGGDGLVFGPVDAFAALAARAAGEVGTATTHADRALELIDEWGLPAVRGWLERLRREADF